MREAEEAAKWESILRRVEDERIKAAEVVALVDESAVPSRNRCLEHPQASAFTPKRPSHTFVNGPAFPGRNARRIHPPLP